MASLTLPEARTQVAGAAKSFTTSMPNPAAPLRSLTEEARAAMMQQLGPAIRHLDEVLEALDGAATSEADELRVTAQAIRHGIFLLIKEVVPDQAWFWTERWQAGERQADRDEQARRSTRYETKEEFLAALDAIDAERARAHL